MWYVKKAASKVMKASQTLIKQESESQKLIKDIISNKHEVMPTKKMANLAANSFQTQKFEQTVSFMIQKLNDIKFEKKSLKKRLNLLVLVAYLIKHGVSGFIDEFRDNIDSFTKYERLSMNDSIEDKESWTKIVLEIQNRAKYIKQLLTDKVVLWREKEVGRLIRQKMMLQKGDYSKHNPFDKQNNQATNEQQKVESFLEHYLWRYTSKLDRKLDQITDALIQKIDKYLDGQIPESFDIDEIEEQSNKSTITKTEFEIKVESEIKKQVEFIKQRMPEHLLIKQTNLLQLQQIEAIKPEQNIDLIEFKEVDFLQQAKKEPKQGGSEQIKK